MPDRSLIPADAFRLAQFIQDLLEDLQEGRSEEAAGKLRHNLEGDIIGLSGPIPKIARDGLVSAYGALLGEHADAQEATRTLLEVQDLCGGRTEMDSRCRRAPEQRLMFCVLRGPPDAKETTAMFRQMAAGPGLGEGWGVVLDLRLREGAWSTQDVKDVLFTLQAVSSRVSGRIAVLAGSEVQYGMGRMTEIHAENYGVPLRAFMDERQAMEWLGEEGVTEEAASR